MEEQDVSALAMQLRDTYGDRAPMEAAMRAESALRAQDADSHEVWKRVLGRLNDPLPVERP